VFRWLTRLFKQHVEAEAAPPEAPTLAPPLDAATPPTRSDTVVAVLDPPAAGLPPAAETPVRAPVEAEPKETCPTCGRTSVFAGPPGQRFCTYCALRDELFDRAAAQE
jgi:hypothetical protein